MRARRGFTLLEILLAISIFSIVMAALTMSFFGVRKSQGVAVSNNLLRVAGQRAIKDIHMELSQSRKLLASTNLQPPTIDVGRQYFLQFQGITSPPAIPFGNMQFPRIDANGGFGVPGANSGELERATVGNTLVFITTAKNLRVAHSAVTIMFPGIPPRFVSTTVDPYYMPALKFVAYYLIEKNLPSGTPAIAGGKTATMQLVRWESKPYIERGEWTGFAGKVVGGAPVAKAAWDKLVSDEGVAGVWDPSAATAAGSIFTVDGAGAVIPAPTGTLFQKKRQVMLAQTDLEPYATGMVAFNTSTAFSVRDAQQVIPVPAYALTDSAHRNFPYGFEVAIAGPSGARTVLVRLTLAARVHAGLNLYGITQQEVVKVFDM
jgi:prepilin-type N-terminal cleavage/methylation domain-containing protein